MWCSHKPVWNQPYTSHVFQDNFPKSYGPRGKPLENTSEMAHTKSKHDQPEQTQPSIGIRIFLFNSGGHQCIWPTHGFLECLNAHLVHQIKPVDRALELWVQWDSGVLESAECVCVFIQVAWSMNDVRENVKSSHEHKVVSQDLNHADCHCDSFCRSGISSAVVCALMAHDRATCAQQCPVNAKGQCKLGQEFPDRNMLLHARSHPVPVFTGFSQWNSELKPDCTSIGQGS